LHTLVSLGWNDALAAAFGPHQREGRVPARISSEHRGLYRALMAGPPHAPLSEPLAEVSGRLRHDERFPAVGDWVAVAAAGPELVIVHDILPRRTWFARLAAGEETRRQVVAANVDLVFVVQGLDRDFNPRRLERTVSLVREGGARPVVVLNKTDSCADLPGRLAIARAASGGVEMRAVSALQGDGVDDLEAFFGPGVTAAVIGSSGVGKSTLVNRLVGAERLRTRAVRAVDQRGRHTTTHRQLVVLGERGLLIDTPGMRELALVDGLDLDATFTDVSSISSSCRFRDCHHEREPGCAVRAALDEGRLDPDRLAAFRKLEREERHAAARTDERLRIEEKKRWKAIHRQQRARRDG
jgi:ribosome biogenesis GTPase